MSKKIPDGIFCEIKKYVPLLCVDVILIKNNEFFLVKRAISPYKNKWCLPGGIIKHNQRIRNRLEQVGREELGVKLEIKRFVGIYEKVYKERHDITHCFIAKSKNNVIQLDHQASKGQFFKRIPPNTGSFYIKMLKDAGFH